MQTISLRAGPLSADIKTDEASFDEAVRSAREEMQTLIKDTNASGDSPMSAPTSTVVIGDGDVVISAQGTSDETFREVHSAVVQEARYWLERSDMVIIDEGDRVDQHIHHHGRD